MSVSVEQVMQTQDVVKLLGEPKFTDSAYDMTEVPVKDDSTIETQEFEVKPTGAGDLSTRFNDPNSQIEFEYNGNDVYNPSGVYFKMEMTTSRTDGGVFVAGENPIFASNVAEVFSNGELYLGSELKEDLHFIGKIDSLLKLVYTGTEWTSSSGGLLGFYPNRWYNSSYNGANPQDIAVTRYPRYTPAQGARTKTSYVVFTLPFGFLRENKKYMKNLAFKIRLFRAADGALFEKQANGGIANSGIPRLTINRISMFVPKITPNLQRQLSYDASIIGDYLLQYNTVYCERKLISNGLIEYNQQLSSLSSTPAKAFIFLQNVARDAAVGVGDHPNPSAYDNCRITKMELTINNKRHIPFSSPVINFETGDYVQVLRNTLKASGALTDYDSGSIISYENFKDVFPVFGFDLQNNDTSNIPELNKLATKVDINIQFDQSTPPGGAHGGIQFDAYLFVVYVYNTVVSVKGNSNITNVIYGN